MSSLSSTSHSHQVMTAISDLQKPSSLPSDLTAINTTEKNDGHDRGGSAVDDAASDVSSEVEDFGIFTEPADFRPPTPPATFIPVELNCIPSDSVVNEASHQEPQPPLALQLRLVGHSPLWGHHLWNAGRVLVQYLERNRERLICGTEAPLTEALSDVNVSSSTISENPKVNGKIVFELGAGAGLPGLASWAAGAGKVVVTDYPDHNLIENLQLNIQASQKAWAKRRETFGSTTTADAALGELQSTGYLWGAPAPTCMEGGCDTLVMGDLLFNHSEHEKLVRSVELLLRRQRDSVALVFFTPYRPWLLKEDLKFFAIAAERGLVAEKVLETVMDKVMFENDRGDELLRRTVYGYELRWRDDLLDTRAG